MIVKGAVCVPGIADYVGDILDEETISEAFLTFNRTGQLIDVQHTLRPVGRVLESYILKSEMKFMGNTYPKGVNLCFIQKNCKKLKLHPYEYYF